MWIEVEKAFCLKTYILTHSYEATRHQFLKKFGFDHRKLDCAPTTQVIHKWTKKFRAFGTVTNSKRVGRGCTVRTDEAIRSVEDSVLQSPKRSLRRRSQSLGINRHTLWQILREDLMMQPYRLSVWQELTSSDMQRRVALAKWFENHPEVLDRMWFSDEAHFCLNGYANSHNVVHWGTDRPN